MSETVDLTLVLACYNEAGHLAESFRRILEVIELSRLRSEIIFVDDFSTDDTRRVIDEITAKSPVPVQKIFHEHNVGRGGSVSDGFRAARAPVVGYLDVDLEVAAHYIPAFVAAIKAGADMAVGRRYYEFRFSYGHRYLMSKGYSWLVRTFLDIPLRDTEAGYKFFRKDALLPLLDEARDRHWFWDTEIMALACLRGCRIAEIPCLFLRRSDKRSTVRGLPDSIEYFRRLWKFKSRKRDSRSKTAASRGAFPAGRTIL